MTTSTVHLIHAIDAKFAGFQASLPANLRDKVSFGYIGNNDDHYDNRSWQLFYKLPQQLYGQGVGGYRTADLPKFLANWEAHERTVRAELYYAYEAPALAR